MASDHEIGRIVAVDTSQVTIELHRELKALTRSTYEGTLEVGRINSYVIIPVGARRIVAMVTRVVLTEESEIKPDKTTVSLPSSKRLMKATMIGTIDEEVFKQGIALFPVLDSPVFITTKKDLDAIFGAYASKPPLSGNEKGFCIPIGHSVVFPDYQIKIDPDLFFGKHAAIIGSTGSGKSCTIASVIQSVLEQPEIKQTRFIILDTNGEYRSAFQKAIKNEKGEIQQWISAIPNRTSLYIPTDTGDLERLTIPYWFMNSDDFVRLFRAAPGVQRPVLLNALSYSRNGTIGPAEWLEVRDLLIQEFNHILSATSGRDWSAPANIEQYCLGARDFLERQENASAIAQLCEIYPDLDYAELKVVFINIIKFLGPKNTKGYYTNLNMAKAQDIKNITVPILNALSRPIGPNIDVNLSSADNPRYFSKQDFRYRYLENAMKRDELSPARTRENSSTMLMRIYRLLEDSRFNFLFGPTSGEWPNINHSLATFIRDILGLESCQEECLSDEKILTDGQISFYDRQRRKNIESNVVIVDLSLLASEVLENVTALIGRLILEFLQRLSEYDVSKTKRGEFPVVLVLEEAQNYIHEKSRDAEESISKLVFERIAREGRKFGLSLVVASQRPSELSKTVLSQCNSFIVHRLQNPEDLRYFREIVPGIYNQLLDQLPALAPRMAMVLGECVQAPVLVEIREVNPAPESKNPGFYNSWTETKSLPDIEAVCAKWEGNVL